MTQVTMNVSFFANSALTSLNKSLLFNQTHQRTSYSWYRLA